MTQYVVNEGIVYALETKDLKNETCVDPYSGDYYQVELYSGGCNLYNFSDWVVVEAENAVQAIALANACDCATSTQAGRLFRKLEAQKDRYSWVVSGGEYSGYVPTKAEKEWMQKNRDEGADLWETDAVKWSRISLSNVIPWGSAKTVLLLWPHEETLDFVTDLASR
jgi:hypothetical protein